MTIEAFVEQSEQFMAYQEKILSDKENYRIRHARLTVDYTERLMRSFHILVVDDRRKLSIAARFHDLLKADATLGSGSSQLVFAKMAELGFPTDLKEYIYTNSEYFPTLGVQGFTENIAEHALALVLHMLVHYDILDREILYPILFHSCPILPTYSKLNQRRQTMIDIITLADKLSSNALRLLGDADGKKAPFNLHLAVFGVDDCEFNFTEGLFLARLLSQGKSQDPYSLVMTQYYFQRLKERSPLWAKTNNIPNLKDLRIKKKDDEE